MNYLDNIVDELDSYCFRGPLTADDDTVTVDSDIITVDSEVL